MENIIVAFSNLPCILPLCTSFMNNDILTTIAIATVSIGSFTSHLIECQILDFLHHYLTI